MYGGMFRLFDISAKEMNIFNWLKKNGCTAVLNANRAVPGTRGRQQYCVQSNYIVNPFKDGLNING